MEQYKNKKLIKAVDDVVKIITTTKELELETYAIQKRPLEIYIYFREKTRR